MDQVATGVRVHAKVSSKDAEALCELQEAAEHVENALQLLGPGPMRAGALRAGEMIVGVFESMPKAV